MSTILIVEDDPLIARIYRTQLEKAGFNVQVVGDGLTGLATAQLISPDAILLDLLLPKLSGCEMLKKLRAMPEFQDLPVVAFTNVYLPEISAQALQAGATQVLDKSGITPKDLVSAFQCEISKRQGTKDQEKTS